MGVKQIKAGRFTGLWKATIDFRNRYAKIGDFEYFELKADAEYWIERIKIGYGVEDRITKVENKLKQMAGF